MNRQQAEGIVDAFEASVKSRSADNVRLRDNLRTVILDAMCEERSYPVTIMTPGNFVDDPSTMRVTCVSDSTVPPDNVSRPLHEVTE